MSTTISRQRGTLHVSLFERERRESECECEGERAREGRESERVCERERERVTETKVDECVCTLCEVTSGGIPLPLPSQNAKFDKINKCKCMRSEGTDYIFPVAGSTVTGCAVG